jgi:hypothetical protein
MKTLIPGAEDSLVPLPTGTASGRRKPVTMTSRRTAALARRLAPGGNVFGKGSAPIPLHEPGWTLRLFNGDLSDGRHYQAVHELGWEPVKPEMLAAKPEELGLRVNEAGYVVRGARGNELICRMPSDDYAEVQRRKTAANLREIGSESRTRDAVANAVASQAGDEGGQYVKDHFVGTVRDTLAPIGG